MASSIKARQNGDEYQYLILWEYILRMLNIESNIEKIMFEYNDNKIKSFDDIIIEYKEKVVFKGKKKIEKEYIQVKYHQYENKFITFNDLMDSKFISAKKSFLQKLKEAYEKLGEDYKKYKFTLYNIYKIDPNDELGKSLYKKDNIINFEKISKSMKEKLCSHLGVEEKNLEEILSQLTFIEGKGIPETIRDLNISLNKHDLVLINNYELENPYLNLTENWFHNNKLELTRKNVLEDCLEFKLKQKRYNESFAIKTFSDYTDYLQEKNIETIDFSEFFTSGKFIKDSKNWEKIRKKLKEWIEKQDTSKEYGLYLECSYSLALLAGTIFNSKCGIPIYPYQKTTDGLIFWKETLLKKDGEKILNIEVSEKKDINTLDSIVIINITHDIKDEVLDFIKEKKIPYSKIYNFSSKNIGKRSVVNENNCKKICTEIQEKLASRISKEKRAITHLFLAAPIALIFYLGKEFVGIGKTKLYEYSNEGYLYIEMIEIS